MDMSMNISPCPVDCACFYFRTKCLHIPLYVFTWCFPMSPSNDTCAYMYTSIRTYVYTFRSIYVRTYINSYICMYVQTYTC